MGGESERYVARVRINKKRALIDKGYKSEEIQDIDFVEFSKMIEALKDSCAVCGRFIDKGAYRAPREIELKDPWINIGLLKERYVCSNCYKKLNLK